jgi:hypothetical protein
MLCTSFLRKSRGKKEGEKEKDPRKKKAVAFFYIEIISSFFPLFSFVPLKSAGLPSIFMSGLRPKFYL